MKIYQKLLRLQQSIKIGKDNYNKFGGFNYRNAEQVLTLVKPLLLEEGLVLLFKEEITSERFMKCTATLVDSSDGEKVETCCTIALDTSLKGMSASQSSGASVSYARKYCLGGLLSIDDGKDADSLPVSPNLRQLVEGCGTISELQDLYKARCGAMSDWERKLFTDRKITLKNQNNGN